MERNLEDEVREVREAIRLIESGEAREIFLVFGGKVYIEAEREEALHYLRRRLEALEAWLRRRASSSPPA